MTISTLLLAGGPAPDCPSFMDAMNDGDAAFRAFDNQSAFSHYKYAVFTDRTNCTAAWKLSRAYADLAMAARKDDRTGLLWEAESMARKSIELCPDSAVTHLRLAIVLGRFAEDAGPKRKIALSKEIRHEAQSALDLEPDNPGAMHVLGRWNYELASLNSLEKSAAKLLYGGVSTGASMEQARDYFQNAVALDPGAALNHFWLAKTLIKLHEYAGARNELQACIDCKDVFWDDHLTKERARRCLEDIKGKK